LDEREDGGKLPQEKKMTRFALVGNMNYDISWRIGRQFDARPPANQRT